MITTRKRNIIIILLVMLVIVFLTLGVYSFTENINNQIFESTETNLSEVATQQQISYDTQVSEQVTALQSIAETLVVLGYNQISIINYLGQINDYHDFTYLIISDESGIGLSSTNEIETVGNLDFFKRSYQGETVITDPGVSEFTGNTVITISVPIYEFGQIVGVVSAEYNIEYFNNLISNSFNGVGYGFIVDENGFIIAGSFNSYTLTDSNFSTNLLELLSNAYIEDGITTENVQSIFLNKQSDQIIYTVENSRRIAQIRPLYINNWSLFTVVPDTVVAEEADSIFTQIIIFNAILGISIIVLIMLIVFIVRGAISRIEKIAYYDELTGIPNLAKFKKDVLEILKKNPNDEFAIVKMDIINFKAINEIFNFEAGNQVIKAVADVGKNVTMPFFAQARIGTDEFLLFGPAEQFTEKKLLNNPYSKEYYKKIEFLKNHSIVLRYGVYYIKNNEFEINEIINKVNLAHNSAKTKNTNICEYNEEFKDRLLRVTEITNMTKFALKNKEFKLFLQPKNLVSNDKLVGAEALVRWIKDDGSMVFPNDFIPVLENNGSIIDLDKYMLERVCETIRKWLDEGKECIPVSVNFSRLHINNENFVKETIEETVNKYDIPRKYIEIEITESTILDHEEELLKVTDQLHKYGYKLSMDDFGSGYSSLGLLKNLNVDVIKIDKSFFDVAKDQNRSEVVLRNMINMAHELSIKTVAEGVETKEQLEFLKETGCEVAQGYFYSKPIYVDSFEENFIDKQ